MSGNLEAVLIGLATGIVAWTLAQLLLTPRLKWSSFVSKFPDETKLNNFSYRVKVKNSSWFRSITAMELHGRVHASDLDPRRPTTSVSIRFATFPGDVKRLSPRAHTLVNLDVGEMSERTRQRLADWGHEEAAADDRSLEDLLLVGGDAFCSVQVLANDGWTGALHYRESPHYRHGASSSDISESTFVVRRQPIDRLYARGRRFFRRMGTWWAGRFWIRLSHPELQKNLVEKKRKSEEHRPPAESSGRPKLDQRSGSRPDEV